MQSSSSEEKKTKRVAPNSADKAKLIRQACREADVTALVGLATSEGGFVNDELRRIAWPLLLGSHSTDPTESADASEPSQAWQKLPAHRDEEQVELDVQRAFVYYPGDDSEAARDQRKRELSTLIVRLLREYPFLCYFQGFHDVVQVLLLVLGPQLAINATARLALLRIRDFMLPSLGPSLAHLQLLPAILYAVDRPLYQHLQQTRPFFALAATLTLYAHAIEDYGEIARLFDFLLAQEAAVSVYVFAQIIRSRRKELFDIPPDDAEMLHFTLSKMPTSLKMQPLIEQAMQMFEKHPPPSLPFRAWSRISSSSVLKTTHGMSSETSQQLRRQTLHEGEVFFRKQAAQLRRQERLQHARIIIWKHRWRLGAIGLAFATGLLAVWLQRNGSHSSTLGLVQALFARLRSAR